MSAAPKNILPWLAQLVNAHQMCVSPGDISGQFGVGQSSYKLTFDIAATGGGPINRTVAVESLPTFVWQVLGYAKSAGAGNGILRRNPVQHPECKWLYASRVDLLQGVAPYGTYQQVPGTGEIGQWNAYRVAVQFETPPYAILPDGVPEYRRYTFMDVEPDTQMLTRQNGAFIWPPGAPRAGQALSPSEAQGVSQRVSKTKLKMMWIGVPDQGLFGASGFATTPYSANIEKAVGTVNDASFLGRDRGTLLLTGWKPIPRIMPVPPAVLGNTFPRAWDVELHFSYFKQQATNIGVAGVVGHNLAPSAKDGKWYRVYLQNGTDTSQYWRYQESSFDNIFKMNG